jgi:5'-3' exoribonuclease 1
MGVPKFYRWLSERYPLINQILSDSTLLPEIDNFYLDMNGIIHACTHPNDQDVTSKSLTFREMVLSIFGYIDRIVTEIVKPKRLLFMAVDGVAPRAKLNQQRARRFRAAQERMEKMQMAKQKGDSIDEHDMFDTNAITPGTEFMDKVGRHLRWFIRKKMKEDPLWRNLEIVFSGHDVPGEGEHKIMQYIRFVVSSSAQYGCNCLANGSLILLGKLVLSLIILRICDTVCMARMRI